VARRKILRAPSGKNQSASSGRSPFTSNGAGPIPRRIAVSRIQVIHWKAAEAGALLDACRDAGFEVDYIERDGASISRAIRANLPAAIVIDLSRLPSHGREVAVWLRGQKSTHRIPIVFVGGEAEKVQRIREILPDASYSTLSSLKTSLKAAIRLSQSNLVTPPAMMERWRWKSAVQKLGIEAHSSVSVVGPPRDFPALLGNLPEGVDFIEDGENDVACAPVTLWFIESLEALLQSLRPIRALANRTKMWVLWKKGSDNGVNQVSICKAAIEVGLVTYKLCAVDAHWSAMLFARKKA
jgi:hypothetical protein